MKATTKIQAIKISEAGAKKMTALTHTILSSRIRSLQGRQFTVVNNESRARYSVSIEPGHTFCQCPFFQENKEHGCCKHIYHLQQEVAWEQARIAEWEERF